jgi:hypothetical protein
VPDEIRLPDSEAFARVPDEIRLPDSEAGEELLHLGRGRAGEELLHLGRGRSVPAKMGETIAYFEAFALWGRAISSLDFVELQYRKISLGKLLSAWARLSSFSVLAGKQAAVDFQKALEAEGKTPKAELVDALHHMTSIGLPLTYIKSTFSHIGAESVSQLLLQSFDEADIAAIETLGIASLLCIRRPVGWSNRISAYIKYLEQEKSPSHKTRAKARFLIEVLCAEYFWSMMTSIEQSVFEKFITRFMEILGVKKPQIRAILDHFEKQRAKTLLLTKDRRT